MFEHVGPFLREGWPRMKKDARVMMWPFVGAVLAGPAVLIFAWWKGYDPSWDEWVWLSTIQFFAFNILCGALFGNEYQERTMEQLLSQPVERLTIWREKLTVAATLLGVCLVWNVALMLSCFHGMYLSHWDDGASGPAIFALTAFTTAPVMCFTGKKPVPAMLATMSFPYTVIFAISAFNFWMFPVEGEWDVTPMMSALLTVWWCGAYWLGRRSFLRLEV